MLVEILKLTDYTYNDTIEEEIQSLLSSSTGLQSGRITTGYSPDYDFMLGNLKIELKLTVKTIPEIEISTANGKPSALALSKSDFYCIIGPGKSKKDNIWEDVFKVRLVKTQDLKNYINKSSTRVSYGVDVNSPGSIRVPVDLKEVDHLWLGEFKQLSRVSFDTNSYKKVQSKFLESKLSQLRLYKGV